MRLDAGPPFKWQRRHSFTRYGSCWIAKACRLPLCPEGIPTCTVYIGKVIIIFFGSPSYDDLLLTYFGGAT